ncbi:hypothetical protein [Herbiconiux sp. YIM B11900]|uniref:hypothetical protein n=1 Tax=Herbiconiux sp. YIM B11900 TaxID=3404131 RepID=UPI003F855DBB
MTQSFVPPPQHGPEVQRFEAPRHSPVPGWHRVRRCAIRAIACCAVWPLALAVARLVSAGAPEASALVAATSAVALVSVIAFTAFAAAKAALWWHGER